MSIITLNWALRLRLPPRTSSAKAVLMVLSYRARLTRHDKFECYPSIDYLAGVTGQNRKTIQSNLTKLQRWGLVSDTGRRMGRTRQVIVYRLHMREKISARYATPSEKAAESPPKTDAKRPKNGVEAARIRATDRSISIGVDRRFSALAREKIGTRRANAASDEAVAGEASARVLAHIEEVVQILRPHAVPRSALSRDADDADAPGGAA